MNNDYRDDNSCCYFHPKEVVVGVCRFCLNERLLILAAKQGQHHHHNHYSSSTRSSSSHRSTYYHHQGITANNNKKPHSINLPKIFAFGSLLNRLEFRHWKSDSYSDHDASSSQEDSFISIKFEDNGVGSWEKGTVSKVSLDHCSVSWKPKLEANEEQQPQKHTKTVIEHAKPRPSLRWRKRIGHLFQVMRWKRSSKANACHAGSTKVEGVKVRNKGWIRTLTKRSKE